MWGFLYGWTLFMVIQTGTMAAVAVGFAKYTGVFFPWLSAQHYLMGSGRLGLTTQQLLAILVLVFLTWSNTRGIRTGANVQNVFTFAKVAALVGLVGIGFVVGRNAEAVASNFHGFWRNSGWNFETVRLVGVAMVGALFSADAWNNVTFTAGEVRNPRRNLPLSLALGVLIVCALYIAAQLVYLNVLTFPEIQNADQDRVATAAALKMLGPVAVQLMAAAIMISTFGTINALTLTGARVYYAMAQQKLFFPFAGRLNSANVPASSLTLQGLWAAALVLPRVYSPATQSWGNLYSDLLEYVISAALIFYVLTVAGVFRLRLVRPDAPRPYRTLGYPFVPAFYITAATAILLVLFVYRPSTTWPGLLIVLIGIPIYLAIRRNSVRPQAELAPVRDTRLQKTD